MVIRIRGSLKICHLFLPTSYLHIIFPAVYLRICSSPRPPGAHRRLRERAHLPISLAAPPTQPHFFSSYPALTVTGWAQASYLPGILNSHSSVCIFFISPHFGRIIFVNEARVPANNQGSHSARITGQSRHEHDTTNVAEPCRLLTGQRRQPSVPSAIRTRRHPYQAPVWIHHTSAPRETCSAV